MEYLKKNGEVLLYCIILAFSLVRIGVGIADISGVDCIQGNQVFPLIIYPILTILSFINLVVLGKKD